MGLPCGCCVKTVKLLVRTEKTVKKKVWKPVIETVCANCRNNCAGGGCARWQLRSLGLPESTRCPMVLPPLRRKTIRQRHAAYAAVTGWSTDLGRSTNPLLSAFVPASPKR